MSISPPSHHFLSLGRPSLLNPFPAAAVDTSTVAAADFDVDTHTGFMPPDPPIRRLTGAFTTWEDTLERATGKLKLGAAVNSDIEREESSRWRESVRQLPVISSQPLSRDERQLRRAHVCLTFIMHFYAHSLPPQESAVSIPAPIAVPLVQVSRELGIRPILTYADTVLWKWSLQDFSKPLSIANVELDGPFTNTPDEAHFYLTSARIELRGVEALAIMRRSMDELFLGDHLAKRRIARYLCRLAVVVGDLASLLMAVREHCDPHVFYHEIRPWFNGGNSHKHGWVYEGVSEAEAETIKALGGPSAGQSSLVHALDAFLGVDHTGTAPPKSVPVPIPNPVPQSGDSTFLSRQQQYMPRHHRAFLQHLASSHSLRDFIHSNTDNQALVQAYDTAVDALKKFRDGHIRIATLYIVNQAKATVSSSGPGPIRGTGGTALVPFLKEARDNTLKTMVGK